MSRTYKDRPYKHRKDYVSWDEIHEQVEYEAYIYDYAVPYTTWKCYREHLDSKFVIGTRTKTFTVKKAGVLKKRKRTYVDKDWYWFKGTPSWWTHVYMTTPKRAACRNWEKSIVNAVDYEEIEDCPDFGRKPHMYYW